MFIEFLTYCSLKRVSILNYSISDIKSKLKRFEIPDSIFYHVRIKFMLHVVAVFFRNPPTFNRASLALPLSYKLQSCNFVRHLLMFKTIYHICFLTLLGSLTYCSRLDHLLTLENSSVEMYF